MTATAHALVGGAIAASIKDPVLGLTLATISHPLMDMVPHWDFGFNWRKKSKIKLFGQCVLDLGVGIVLAYFLFGQGVDWKYFFLAILASESWDLMEAPYWFFKWKFFPFSLIYNTQSKIQNKAQLPWGGITQVLTVCVVVLLMQLLT